MVKKNNKCPNKCKKPNYKSSLDKANILSKLNFKCPKCEIQFPYDGIMKHVAKCKQDKNIEENKDNNKTKIKRLEKEEIGNVSKNKEIHRITCKNNK